MESYSQAHQDLFVLECLNRKRDGFFLDLGCHDPTWISNTYLLERDWGWTGIAIDLESSMISRWSGVRSCRAFAADCTTVDYDTLLGEAGVIHVDYLSLDLDGDATLRTLRALPFGTRTFGVITFEHDLYRFGPEIRDTSRGIFAAHGYHLLCRDVTNCGHRYEDWYVHPDHVNLASVMRFTSEGMDHSDIIKL
jgi:hypothetical protein